MRIILSKKNNPFENLATEEYLLKNFTEDIFFLYINSKSIVVGKHQNTLSEINHSFISENNIPVIRRLSGGGTVFHDLGNINFCFITSGAKGELVNFKKYTSPMVSFLNAIDVAAHFGGRNDILIDGCKISGNASHVFKSRVMHHGTLLFNSELSSLTNALKNDPTKFKDKAVKSVRSKVTNIHSHLKTPLTINEFIEKLYEYIHANYNCKKYILSENDYDQINKLVEDKFKTWEWNYGYSPKFELKKRTKTSTGKRFEFTLQVVKGTIKSVNIKSNSTQKEWVNDLENSLTDIYHRPDSIQFSTEKLFEKAKDLKLNELLEALF
ncbi:lipoate--protein ligase [Labilibacter sediminis]|nr:lipoate--protein ligase [Labilibacter sediminis]